MREAVVFDSKLSMLVRMVQTQVGAQVLIENGLLQRLIGCQWIDQRPDYSALGGKLHVELKEFEATHNLINSDEENNWAPGIIERYHNFLESILRIIASLLVALPQNLGVASKVRQ